MSAPTTPTDGSSQFKMGKLRKDVYASAQEFADDIASSLEGSKPINGAESGSRITKKTERLGVQSGATFAVAPYNVSDCILNLECSDESPTVGILCAGGTKITFTGAIPTAGYTLVITKIGVL